MQMRATTGDVNGKPSHPTYSPSVPISVYRELVTELKAVQSKLDVVTNHNQKLVQENQYLLQEVNRVVQSCLELQNLLDSKNDPGKYSQEGLNKNYNTSPNPINSQNTPYDESKSLREQPIHPTHPKNAPKPKSEGDKKNTQIKNKTRTNFKTRSKPSNFVSRGLNGWWLFLIILVVMVSGFSAGYLVVRPFLQRAQITR
ncbi:hypothetical protein [Cylindrospermopsis raciborskii]|jgi:hypothetical protein|uniref:hypothetical protein n=1 Tax=Cylindrospermopsis raciborskii TaxID=77022 RepID=UPI000E1EC1FB|nr:hypothetical protein [Cylindrospermopsis raciborskii]UJL32406.1 hypothetical protein C6N34_009235 [Cylindrospermopsis raciborskii Cr2010]UJS04844.1 hypothetical protein L3I90_00825 [Cylindrospermopsis raciborskii KLL07]